MSPKSEHQFSRFDRVAKGSQCPDTVVRANDIGNLRRRKTKRLPAALIFCLCLLLRPAVMQASPVEHPGILHQDDNCSSCHADKITGKSVHSGMAIACTVCHLAQTQGDMTTLNLAMPKERICFACHEKVTEVNQRSSLVKGLCLDCHDAHRSSRRMLLREQTPARHCSSELLSSRVENASHKAHDQP